MLAPQTRPIADVDAFLDWLEGQEERHEFVDGRIVAMARTSVATTTSS